MNKLTIAFLAAVSIASFGCKKKGGAAEAMSKMTEFKDKMCACKDKACADKIQEDMTKWSTEMAKNAGKDESKPSDDDMKKMATVTDELGKCMAKAMGAPDMGGDKPADGSAAMGDKPADGSAAPAAGGGGDLPAECNDYKAAIEALAKCDKLPQTARDQMKQAYDQTSAAWANVPAEGKAGLATACKAAADATIQAAAACK